MREIAISVGKFVTQVDDEDYGFLVGLNWNKHKLGYAYRLIHVGRKCVGSMYMHRIILQEPNGIVDHIDRNPLNNQKYNLRVVGKSENALNNSKQKNNTSGCRGVDFDKARNKWTARLKVGGVEVLHKRFYTIEEAVQARKEAIARYGIIAE